MGATNTREYQSVVSISPSATRRYPHAAQLVLRLAQPLSSLRSCPLQGIRASSGPAGAAPGPQPQQVASSVRQQRPESVPRLRQNAGLEANLQPRDGEGKITTWRWKKSRRARARTFPSDG